MDCQGLLPSRVFRRALGAQLVLCTAVIFMQPRCFFNLDGTLRQFGTDPGRTVFPMPVFFAVLGVLVYMVSAVYETAVNGAPTM